MGQAQYNSYRHSYSKREEMEETKSKFLSFFPRPRTSLAQISEPEALLFESFFLFLNGKCMAEAE